MTIASSLGMTLKSILDLPGCFTREQHELIRQQVAQFMQGTLPYGRAMTIVTMIARAKIVHANKERNS